MALVMVDGNATAAVAAMLADILPRQAFALTLQNGIGNVEALAAALGEGRVMAGSTYNSGARLEPGKVAHTNVGNTTIGELDGRNTERIRAVATLFEGGGLPVTVSDNVMGTVWMKFVLNVAINPVSAVTGLRSGQIARTPSALALMEHILDEVLAVMAAKGVRLPIDDPRAYVIDHAWVRYNRPSMLQHVEAGRRTEIDSLNGALLREAEALRHPLPVQPGDRAHGQVAGGAGRAPGGIAGDRRGGAGSGGKGDGAAARLTASPTSARPSTAVRGRRCG